MCTLTHARARERPSTSSPQRRRPFGGLCQSDPMEPGRPSLKKADLFWTHQLRRLGREARETRRGERSHNTCPLSRSLLLFLWRVDRYYCLLRLLSSFFFAIHRETDGRTDGRRAKPPPLSSLPSPVFSASVYAGPDTRKKEGGRATLTLTPPPPIPCCCSASSMHVYVQYLETPRMGVWLGVGGGTSLTKMKP